MESCNCTLTSDFLYSRPITLVPALPKPVHPLPKGGSLLSKATKLHCEKITCCRSITVTDFAGHVWSVSATLASLTEVQVGCFALAVVDDSVKQFLQTYLSHDTCKMCLCELLLGSLIKAFDILLCSMIMPLRTSNYLTGSSDTWLPVSWTSASGETGVRPA